MNLPTWWVLIVLILKTDECASAFSLSGFEKVPPQQADLIMKGNFQGVYAEKLINVITRNLSQMPKLLV